MKLSTLEDEDEDGVKEAGRRRFLGSQFQTLTLTTHLKRTDAGSVSQKRFLHLTSRLLVRVSLLPVLNMDAPVSCSFLVASDLFLLENRKS